MFRDAFRWIYMKYGLYRAFAPRDLTLPTMMDKLRTRSRRKEAAQDWDRRRSEQTIKDAQERRTVTRRAALVDQPRQPSDTIPPETPMGFGHHGDVPQTGMLAVYQKINSGVGRRRTGTMENV